MKKSQRRAGVEHEAEGPGSCRRGLGEQCLEIFSRRLKICSTKRKCGL